MESFDIDAVLSRLSNFKTIITGLGLGVVGGTLAAATGVTPKIGVLRAFTVGLRSYFQSSYSPISVRKDEIKFLRVCLQSLEGGSYIVVTGEKGIGKTNAIDTALRGYFGVMKLSVSFLYFNLLAYI